MIPKSLEDVLNPMNRIDECADYNEIIIWLNWMHSAIQKVSEDLAEAKILAELAEFEYEKEYGTQFSTIEAPDVTTRKIKATICESVVEKQKNMIYMKYMLKMAEAAVEGVKTRDGCIRKMATLRSNSLTSFTNKDDNDNVKSFTEQPYTQNVFGNNKSFMQ